LKIVLIGYGSIGQALTPMLRRHFPALESLCAFAADDDGVKVAEQYGVRFARLPFTEDNFRPVLAQALSAGDLLINVSVDVSIARSDSLVPGECRHVSRYLPGTVERRL
jgi:homospermidine synthase